MALAFVMSGLGFACNGLAKVGFNVLVARVAGAAALGVVNVALASALLLAIPLEFAASGTQKHMAEALGAGKRGRARGALLAGALITALVAAVVVGGAALAGLVVPDAALAPLLLGLALLQGFATLAKRALFALDQARAYAMLELASLAAFAALLLGGGLSGLGWLWAFAVQYAVLLAGAAVVVVRELGQWQAEPRPRMARDVASFGALSFGGYAAALGVRYAAVVVAGAWAGAVASAHVAAAMSIALLLTFFMVVYQQVALPHIARLHGAGDAARVERFAVASYRLMAAGMAVTAAPLIVLAPWLVPRLFGPGFEPAVLTLQVLLLATMVTVVTAPLAQVLHGTRHVRLSPVSGALQVAAAAACWALLVPSMGALGAAVGLLAASCAGAALYHVATARWLGIPARVHLRPGFGLVAVTACGLAVMGLSGSSLLGLAALLALAVAYFWREVGLGLRLAREIGPFLASRPRSVNPRRVP
ncbi:MAG TPA: polysaccharide biosynthesis C-terminal domain-containing protein [Candidatus Thermoplasmatota archaeon]|nr:polysaccharide biosynthesis C-terminal domain-containing protein [Candidatus Thermoplasmatota archaeon]